MKVAVLGSGNGACAVAFEWAKAGHEVFMFDFAKFPKMIGQINAHSGIFAEGELEGFQKIAYAGDDIEKVLDGAGIILAVGPAYSTEPFGLACKPFVRPGQHYVVCPSSCAGAIVFKNALGLSFDDYSVTISETSTLPFAVRITGAAKISVYNRLKGGYFLSTLPSSKNEEIFEIFHATHETCDKADNILQTTLQNANPVIHPAVTICNTALIERTGGDFMFYEEGVTDGVGRVIEALDRERISIGAKLGVNVIPDPELGMIQGYQAVANYSEGYSKAPGFIGIKAQPQLDYRYFNEDVGYGLVFLISLAKQIGVEVPAMEAVVKLACLIMGRDYRAEEARSMRTLGLDKYDLDGLKKVLKG
jgi:Glycerol-3-phosphate dehydrogenase